MFDMYTQKMWCSSLATWYSDLWGKRKKKKGKVHTHRHKRQTNVIFFKKYRYRYFFKKIFLKNIGTDIFW